MDLAIFLFIVILILATNNYRLQSRMNNYNKLLNNSAYETVELFSTLADILIEQEICDIPDNLDNTKHSRDILIANLVSSKAPDSYKRYCAIKFP